MSDPIHPSGSPGSPELDNRGGEPQGPTDEPRGPDGESHGPAEPRKRSLLSRIEPFLWLGLAVFVLVRFGPQLSAWTGIGPPSSEESQPVPSLEVQALDGSTIGPETTRGRVQVITFWATWCSVCRLELPAVQRVHEAWEGSDQVVVLGLSIDGGSGARVLDHGRQEGFTFPLVMAGNDLRRAFGGIPGIPTTFVVDRQGTIRHTLVGLSGPGTLQRAVRRLVEEDGSSGAQPPSTEPS